MFYCQNTKIFASRRSLSDRSQMVAKQRGGEFLPKIPRSQIPNFFSPAAGFRSLFWGFSRFVARRRRKNLPFYTSETRFPLRKSMFLLPKYQNFRLRRNLSDRSQNVAKQWGNFSRRRRTYVNVLCKRIP